MNSLTNNANKPWYPYQGAYKGDSPPYYDLNGIAWYDQLKQNIPEIRAKLLAFLEMDGVDIIQFFNKGAVEDKGWWGGIAFMFWGLKNEKLMHKGKDVFEYFKNIPGLVSLSVSVLKPKTRLKEHIGDTDAIYRIHIPIYIPAPLPDCGITVSGITKPWIDDDIIVFCDAHAHSAWNMTDKTRIVIIMDVIKEEFLPETDKICATVLASMKFQLITNKYKFVKKMVEWIPQWIKDIGRGFLKLSPGTIFKQRNQ